MLAQWRVAEWLKFQINLIFFFVFVTDYTRTPTSSHVVLSNDVADCRQSLSDIRDRIGSLQSLLQTSRSLTSSMKTLQLADRPSFILPRPGSGRPAPCQLPEAVSDTPNEDKILPQSTLPNRPVVGLLQPLEDRPIFSIQPTGDFFEQSANQQR
jgi:hypothetical protein